MKKLLYIIIGVVIIVFSLMLVACTQPKEIESVVLKLNNAQLEYEIGDEFDAKDAVLDVKYSNGESETVAVTKQMIKDFDSTSYGSKVVKIEYLSSAYSFPVNVDIIQWVDIYSTVGTLPTLYSALNICSSNNDSYMIFDRTATLDVEKIPTNVKYIKSDTPVVGKADLVSELNEKIKNMAEEKSYVKFNLFCDDMRVQRAIQFFVLNNIPESRFKVTLLSDGTGTYGALFKDVYYNEGTYSKYLEYATEFDAKWQNAVDGIDNLGWNIGEIQLKFAALHYSQKNNVKYWMQYPELLDSLDAKVTENVQSAHLMKKEPNEMFAAFTETQKNSFFKFVKLNKTEMDALFDASNKPNMIITGTSPKTQAQFASLMQQVYDTFGQEYDLFFKPHPVHLPVSGGANDKDVLDNLGIVVLPAQLPMEAIMWAYPDLAIGGYNSSLYMSAKNANVKFFFNITDGSQLTAPLNDLYTKYDYYKDAQFFNEII